MNKRIQEFAKQSGLIQYDTDGKLLEAEVFAELIIKECARIASETPCPYTDETMRQQLGHTWDMACIESANNIRKNLIKSIG